MANVCYNQKNYSKHNYIYLFHFSNDNFHVDVTKYSVGEGFDSQIPSEWESWLRMRRDDPPTDKQVLQAYALGQLKKKNAAELGIVTET